jgi:hypothetical protein
LTKQFEDKRNRSQTTTTTAATTTVHNRSTMIIQCHSIWNEISVTERDVINEIEWFSFVQRNELLGHFQTKFIFVEKAEIVEIVGQFKHLRDQR